MSQASLTRPWMFVLDCRSIRNASTGSNAPAVSRLRRRFVLVPRSFFLGTDLPVTDRVKSVLYDVQCPQGKASSNDAEGVSKEPNGPQRDMRIFQTWRNPSWLHHYQIANIRDAAPRRAVRYQPFKGIRDALFRFACMGLVFASLGALHYLYHRADRFARHQVQVASAKLNGDISIGRVARCNPFTGVRVRNVSVSRISSHSHAPFGTASYVDASISGLFGLLLQRRALQLNVSVERANVTVPQIVTNEYERRKMETPQLEEPIRIFAGEWRESATWRSLCIPGILEPSIVSFQHSRLRLQGTQRSPVSESDHIVEMVNVSGRLDLSTRAHSTPAHRQQRENGMEMIFVKGNLRGGGSARLGISTAWSHDAPAKAPVPSVAATLTCSKFNIGSIASFIPLPFKLIDGYCTGSVDLELSPNMNAIPTMNGQAEIKSLGIRFDPNPESPELRNLAGKVRFKEKSLLLGQVEGHLGSIPLEAEGRIDFVEGFNIVSHARPFDVNKIIDTFALDRFIPVGGSVIGKAVVRGELDEPFVSGWIKAVGNRATADRVLLKSAVMMYDWDTAAGNLLFPSIKAEVVGGGEVTGSGGIYFDMTQETPYGCLNEQHHSRNPKAQYWNPGVTVDKFIPSPPTDDFEVDKWAPFRPYDSMAFKIEGSGVSGPNLVRWYGPEYGAMATEAVGLMSGSCRISGHVDDANSRLVWRSVREALVDQPHEKSPAVLPSSGAINKAEHVNGRKLTQFGSTSMPAKSGPQGDEAKSHATNDVLPSQHLLSQEQENTEYLGGVVHMKLGDLPEARRVKVRTILRGFNVKRLFAGDPAFREVLLRAPNAVSHMDTFFKGTVCMRPSWEDPQAWKAGLKTPLDLVSIDGALAVRKLTINDVTFRNVISGSLSVSATDISVSLTERNSQDTGATDENHPPVFDGRKDRLSEQTSLDRLEINVNARGILNVFMKQGKSEMSTSISLDDRMHRVAQLHAKNLNLQELSGEFNPLYEEEALQGILNTSIRLDLTDQTGLINCNVTDLALGPLHFGFAEAQFQLRKGEISLLDATVQQRLSKYRFNGKFVSRGNFSDFDCLVNVDVDRAHIRDLARLVEGGMAIMDSVPARHEAEDHMVRMSYRAKPWMFQMRNELARQDSSVTYWEVPPDLPFSEQTRWYSESLQKDSDTDLSWLLDADNNRTTTPFRLYHTDNHLTGRISITYAPRQNRSKRKYSALRTTDTGLLQVFGNTSLSFNLSGRNWILGEDKIELMTVSGFLEDGSLSVGPFQLRGNNGFLADAECRVTNAGSLNGSVNLRNAPVSNFEVFRKAGFQARGDISGKFGIQGTISNPSVYGQMLWQDATVNGRNVHQPHADLACSNGRCVINVDAEVGGKGRQRNVNHAGADDLAGAEAVDKPLFGDTKVTGFTPMKSTSSKRRKDVDSVRARISIPVKLFVHQYVLPRVPRGVLPDHLGAFDDQLPFDDDFIYASVDVKRYGMVLLNAAMPKLGWIGGESDILIRVSGTLENPQVEGTVKFRDGSMRPVWMVHPLHSLKGEVELRDSGVISCKSLSGRCHGRGFSLRGGMFLSKKFEDRLQNKVQEMQEVMSVSNSGKKKRSRILRDSLEESVSRLSQGRGGIRVEAGGIPIHVDNVCSGTVSGKFSVKGTAMNPEIDGSLLFSEGVVNANSALSDAGKAMRARSRSPVVSKNLSVTGKTMPGMKERAANLNRVVDDGEVVEENGNDPQSGVELKHLKVNLGRNVRVAHSFLFNVLVTGNTSLSGDVTNPSMTGKVNILSGSVSALPARWTIRKSESSYISFAHNPDDTEEKQELMIKLALESDTMILRVSECEASTWMENLSLSDKSGSRVPEGWSDAIHASDDDSKGNRRRIVNMLTGLMINTLVVGGEIGKYDWRVFPTYFGDVLPRLSKSAFEKYGAGFQLDQGNMCLESNMFFDKLKGGQVMVKLAKAVSVHLFGDQNRRFANLELRLPGRR